MAQGKAYTPTQKTLIIQSLREFLELGYSRNKACGFIGLNPQTLSEWVSRDEALLMKVQGWENMVNNIVRKNLVDSIKFESADKNDKKENSKWWAERKMKGEFSTRTEQTGADGAPLFEQEQKEKVDKVIEEFLNN